MDFKAVLNDQPVLMPVMTVIRKDEIDLWDACREMIKSSLASAKLQIRGVFVYDMLSIEMFKGLEIFQWGELTQLLVNHARKMAVGETRLIQYCSLFGLFKKVNDVDWGDIQWNHAVTTFDKEPEQLDLFLKRLVKSVPQHKQEDLVQAVFYDLSRIPVFDDYHQEQMERLKSWKEKLSSDPSTAGYKIFMVDKNGCRNMTD